ncbi:iron chaperone [Leuconostoc holzapfelii]
MMSDKTTFSDFEREAMRERAAELRKTKNSEADLLEKVAEMPEAEAQLALKIHEIVTTVAPELQPKTWYGMPAYANAQGKTLVFFQPATKFKARYSTLGFNDGAQLDDGQMWPTAYAITALTPAVIKQIETLVKQSVGR